MRNWVDVGGHHMNKKGRNKQNLSIRKQIRIHNQIDHSQLAPCFVNFCHHHVWCHLNVLTCPYMCAFMCIYMYMHLYACICMCAFVHGLQETCRAKYDRVWHHLKFEIGGLRVKGEGHLLKLLTYFAVSEPIIWNSIHLERVLNEVVAAGCVVIARNQTR